MNSQGISESCLIKDSHQPRNAIEASTVWTPRVLMIGPSLQEEGGMGTVSRLILSHVKDLDINHVASWNNLPGSIRLPSKLRVIQVFCLAWIRLFAELLLNPVDILHFHMSERGSAWRTMIFATTAYAFGKPVIIHTHGAEFHLFYEKLPKFSKQLINWVLQKTSYLIVLSESWRKYYVFNCQLSPEKVIVLRNPVEYPIVAPSRDDSQPIKLLFLGKINQRKGIYDLLNSYAAFKQNCQIPVKLIIAGSGEIELTLKLAEKLGISQDLNFLGWINPVQKNELLAQVHGFVLPSYNEGLPMALLEAMSWGLSIITTPVGGIGEVIKDRETGLLVEPGNIEQLTAAIRLLVTDHSLRSTLGVKAREKAAEFKIDNYTDSLSGLYFKTLETSKK